MADNTRYKPLKNQLENNYLPGKESYPATVVESERLPSDFIVPERSGGGNIKRDDNAAEVAFTESLRAEYKKTVQCYRCKKGGITRSSAQRPRQRRRRTFSPW